jgi:hypothetical protein
MADTHADAQAATVKPQWEKNGGRLAKPGPKPAPKKRKTSPQQRRNRPMTGLAVRKFLTALENGETNGRAAFIAGHDRQRFYDLKKKDPEFGEAWANARAKGADHLEQLLQNRINQGYTEEIRDGEGRLVRRINKYYPQDLHLALKALRPEDYRDNYVSPQVQVGVNIQFEDRSASLAELYEVLTAAGVTDQYRGSAQPQVAGARELLAAPRDR